MNFMPRAEHWILCITPFPVSPSPSFSPPPTGLIHLPVTVSFVGSVNFQILDTFKNNLPYCMLFFLLPALIIFLPFPVSNSTARDRVRDEWLKFWVVACLWERKAEVVISECSLRSNDDDFCTLLTITFSHHIYQNPCYFQASRVKSPCRFA